MWFDSQKMQEIFPSTDCLGQLLASTWHPVQLVLGTLSEGMTKLGCEGYHTFLSIAKIKHE